MSSINRIGVVGAGSSGLIALKYLRETFPSAKLVCFEKGYTVRGCWGSMKPGFVSTSTRYTTQFSCFQQFEAETPGSGDFAEFYRGGEFGDYLERFAEQFGLLRYIRFGTAVESMRSLGQEWELKVNDGKGSALHRFDALYLCTGLVNERRAIDASESGVEVVTDIENVSGSRVVVVGGGESAVDLANTLAAPEKNNTVYLSLRSGIRVSPRYHPIKGVPSDYLRNRLLLSIRESLRNHVGNHFVSFRIRFSRLLKLLFPSRRKRGELDESHAEIQKMWELKLKSRARDSLFNVFHNKSDRFLAAVADGRIQIIGPAVDGEYEVFHDFDQEQTLQVSPDVLVPSMGYRSKLGELSGGVVELKDFYKGCAHIRYPNLMLIGFARPIIGNIPTISEMQVKYTTGLLARQWGLPSNVEEVQQHEHQALCDRYPALDTELVYPVDQIPYCDMLAREMGSYPTLKSLGSLRLWIRVMLSPACTLQYQDKYFDKELAERQPIYVPVLITAFLLGVMCVDALRQIVMTYRKLGAGDAIGDLSHRAL